MILQKCCHDLDILRWIVGEPCETISSLGSLRYFHERNAPAVCALHCSDCKNTACKYRAQTLYTHPDYKWMARYFWTGEPTDENILSALTHTQYDQCVFHSDNDVVDHQVTILEFANQVTASHSMTAFSKEIYRDIKIHGTKAELVGVMEKALIELRPFEGEVQQIPLDPPYGIVGGHGGGDAGMMHEIYLDLNGEKTRGVTYLDVSIDSHRMAFGAEESRRSGATVKLTD